ncbi:hypothetical protein WJX74_009866 [Apatococcus lobatus]|uniref:AP2/ERF domain-containing protein n=1 Tax=Apatococcus lobatus TaxID=904363 RepID=A0AAW1SCB4_9CHLO
MEVLASPSSSTSGSYLVAETAGIDDHGEIFSGPCSTRATQSSGSRKEAAAGPVEAHLSMAEHTLACSAPDSSQPHQVTRIRTDGNNVTSEPGHEGGPVVDDNGAAQSAEPQPGSFQDYDEELDYIDEDDEPVGGHAGHDISQGAMGHDVVAPPPLAYIQQAAGVTSSSWISQSAAATPGANNSGPAALRMQHAAMPPNECMQGNHELAPHIPAHAAAQPGTQLVMCSHGGSGRAAGPLPSIAPAAGSATELSDERHAKPPSKAGSKGKGKASARGGRDDGPEQWDPRRPDAQKTVCLSEWLSRETKDAPSQSGRSATPSGPAPESSPKHATCKQLYGPPPEEPAHPDTIAVKEPHAKGLSAAAKERRRPNFFNMYVSDEVKCLKAANPGLDQSVAFGLASSNWKDLSGAEKAAFKAAGDSRFENFGASAHEQPSSIRRVEKQTAALHTRVLLEPTAAQTSLRTKTAMAPAHTGSFTSQSHVAQDGIPDVAMQQDHVQPSLHQGGSSAIVPAHHKPPQPSGAAPGMTPARPLPIWSQHPQHFQPGPGSQPQYYTPNGAVLQGADPLPSWTSHQQQAQQPVPLQHQHQHLHLQPHSTPHHQHAAVEEGSLGMPDLEAHPSEADFSERQHTSRRQPGPSDLGDEVEAAWDLDSPSKRKKAKPDEPSLSYGHAGNKLLESRSSKFKGVTKHRRSGRWEAHIWVKEMGRQVYLGGFEHEAHAAEVYDVAALRAKGSHAKLNFPRDRYADLMEYVSSLSLDELAITLRRQSQGFSRGSSKYRGVTHHPTGRWESRIGIPGSRHLYLGLFESEREAAVMYDRALVRLRGAGAATNFGVSDYKADLAAHYQMKQAELGFSVVPVGSTEMRADAQIPESARPPHAEPAAAILGSVADAAAAPDLPETTAMAARKAELLSDLVPQVVKQPHDKGSYNSPKCHRWICEGCLCRGLQEAEGH